QLRSDIRVALQKTDEAYNKALAATDELHDTRRQLEIAAEQRQQLLAETGRMTSVMREEGLDPSTSIDDVAPRVDGFVQSVSRRGGQILVQVSIGHDDGLRKGHTLEVFQGTKYLGRLKVLSVEPDQAIGVVDPRYQTGRIQEGQRVATRLNLG
ncbi:MAG: hypothetical protein KDA37_01730, partial [Planctomycetales bacterium]|nr:hypothetical protein [Planctomycetales bacterium]